MLSNDFKALLEDFKKCYCNHVEQNRFSQKLMAMQIDINYLMKQLDFTLNSKKVFSQNYNELREQVCSFSNVKSDNSLKTLLSNYIGPTRVAGFQVSSQVSTLLKHLIRPDAQADNSADAALGKNLMGQNEK